MLNFHSRFGKSGRPKIDGKGSPGPGSYDSVERKVTIITFLQKT